MNTYVRGLQPIQIYLLLQRGDRLQTSEYDVSFSAGIDFRRQSDVYRRQILTSIVDPHAARVNAMVPRGPKYLVMHWR